MSQASLEDLIQIGPEGLHYIAGGTGLNTSIKLTKDRTERFFMNLSSSYINTTISFLILALA